ncbi:MAG: NUDIX hydrolase [Chitinophagaceae bacterium]|nr:MAG: NUDIX hydrolase [Chitinophagaceae bacterium]
MKEILKTAQAEKNSHLDYFNIAISVDCVIFCYEDRELKVLTMPSDLKEFAGLPSLLGDLVRPDEDLDSASYRVLLERTGMEDVYLEQVHTFGSIGRHPSGRVITTAYYALIDIKHQHLKLGNKLLTWQRVKDLKRMAFDHKPILDTCLISLREKVMDQPVVFNLLPEKFSLRELQELYQSILLVELDRRNFRKKIGIKDWLLDLDEMEVDVPHRPGKLYKVKPEIRRRTAARRPGSLMMRD